MGSISTTVVAVIALLAIIYAARATKRLKVAEGAVQAAQMQQIATEGFERALAAMKEEMAALRDKVTRLEDELHETKDRATHAEAKLNALAAVGITPETALGIKERQGELIELINKARKEVLDIVLEDKKKPKGV